MSILNTINEKTQKLLDEKNLVTNSLEFLESKTGINRKYLFFGIAASLIVCLMLDWSNFLCNLIGFLYPAYESIKAIESHDKEDDKRWLTYWCVYALFGILEYFSDKIFFWVPFYSLTKCAFLIWLMVPGSTGGAAIIYNRFIKVFIVKHQERIENGIEQVKDTVIGTLSDQATKIIKQN